MSEEASDPRDEQGHLWRETFLKELFPLVCARCLARSDNPVAWQPCRTLEVSGHTLSEG